MKMKWIDVNIWGAGVLYSHGQPVTTPAQALYIETAWTQKTMLILWTSVYIFFLNKKAFAGFIVDK